MVLRMVAGETPRPNRRAMVWLPAGSAVSMYVWTTASRTRSSRSLSCSGAGIAVNLAGLGSSWHPRFLGAWSRCSGRAIPAYQFIGHHEGWIRSLGTQDFGGAARDGSDRMPGRVRTRSEETGGCFAGLRPGASGSALPVPPRGSARQATAIHRQFSWPRARPDRSHPSAVSRSRPPACDVAHPDLIHARPASGRHPIEGDAFLGAQPEIQLLELYRLRRRAARCPRPGSRPRLSPARRPTTPAGSSVGGLPSHCEPTAPSR